MNAFRKPTVAVLTPPGRAAIATIVVDAHAVETLIQRWFQPSGGKGTLPIHRIRHGRWKGAGAEEIVLCRRSATRVELHCHGGAMASSAIVHDLESAGATCITWQDWLRASTTSTIQYEAHLAFSQATTQRTALILLDQYQGALAHEVKQIHAVIGAGDYQRARRQLVDLSATARIGLHLTRPWRVVLWGKPNVGKSCLMNAIVGYDRAIVHERAGTTRDVLLADTAINGWPVQLVDTAGVRTAIDAIEREGVARTLDACTNADILVNVLDLSQPILSTDVDEVPTPGSADLPRIVVGNKQDLLSATDAMAFKSQPARIDVSAKYSHGIPELLARLSQLIAPTPPAAGCAMVFTHRQHQQLTMVLDSMNGDCWDEAQRILDDLD